MGDVAARQQVIETQLALLRSSLTAVSRTRSSLPSLLRSFSLPNPSAEVYRTRSTECYNSIKALKDSLETAQETLTAAEESEKADPRGIVVKKVEEGERKETFSWKDVGGALGDGSAEDGGKGKGKSKTPVLGLKEPTSLEELKQVCQAWEERYGRVKIVCREREMEVVVRGLLRAMLRVYWYEVGDDGDLEESKVAVVERVACFALGKEDGKSSHQPSSFTLFQNITNDAMDLVNKSLRRDKGGRIKSNVEEVLSFLSDPPVPF